MPWLKDRKWCHIRIEGTTFGDVPLNAELKLEVWDSPNSAGVIIDAIRCLRIGLDRGLKGTLVAPSSYFMKSPPLQIHDDVAHQRVEAFIRGEDNETLVGTEESRKDAKALAAGEGSDDRQAAAAAVTPTGTAGSRRPTGASKSSPRDRRAGGDPRLQRDGRRSRVRAAAAVARGHRHRGTGQLPRLAGEAPVLQRELRPRAGAPARASAASAGSPCAHTASTRATSSS